MKPVAPRLDIVRKLSNEFAERLVIQPWWESFFAALDDPKYHELLLSVVRQTGKSTLAGAAAISEVMCCPGSYTLLVSASKDQQAAIFERKIRKPLERALGTDLRKQFGAKFTAHGIALDRYDSRLEVIASEAATGTGRTPTLLIIDEARDVDDSVYLALAPSVLGAGGKLVILSSAGRPRGFFYELLKNPTPEQWVYRSSENNNPRASRGLLDFLRRRLALVSPVAAQRELANEFAEDGESLLPSALIDAAVDDCLGELPGSDGPAFCFVDLSRRHDLTSVVVVVREGPRRPEAADHLVVASLRVWNPRECPNGETDFAEVRAHLRSLPVRFPNLEAIRVDEGAEAGTVLPFARQDARLSLITEGFVASVTSNMDLWGALAARLHARTLSIPRDDRLIAELRGLRREEFALGSKWRVVDSSRKLHRDISVALAGACMLAGNEPEVPLMLIGGATYEAWQAQQRAPLPPSLPNEDDGEGTDEIIEASDAEMAERADAEQWEKVPDFLPSSERRRRHHEAVREVAEQTGWFPEDAA